MASRIVAPEAAGYNQQQLPASNFDPDYQPIGRTF
jgi:hypothetical protein